MGILKNLRQKREGPEGNPIELKDWEDEDARNESLSESLAREIVNAYGQALVASSQLTGPAAGDENLLPYPKDVIRKAIELLIEGDTDKGRINLLRAGLMYLEDFN